MQMTSETPPIEPYGGSLDFNGNGIAGCVSCGWRGVPSSVAGVVSVVCPSCYAGAEHERPEAVPFESKVGRNERCPCGSGKKWKRCCGR